MSIDCTHCESVLLDLLYGELAPQHEREVRTHILECPNCRKALSRLEAGQALARHLPDEAPPPELTEKIVRAAQVHVRRNSGSWLERIQLVIESMARVAMTRQAAMVTLSLLIVFVGLWSYPELTRRREAHPSMVVEPTDDGEAGPSREIAAAPPPTPSAVPAETASEPEALDDAVAKSARAPSSRKTAAEGAAKRGERLERQRASASPAAERAKADKPAEAKGRFAPPPPKAKKAEASTAERPQLAAAERETPASTDDLLQAPVTNRADSPALGGAAESSAPAATAAAPPAGPVTLEDVFKAGVERYRAEDYPAAAQLFSRMLESSAPSAQRAAALLYLARSERALGRCDRAIRAYETLVRSYGSSQQSSSALTEGLACYDRLGDAAGAARLLEHASSVPSLSVQAARTAQERSAPKPAEPAAPAQPAPARP